MTNSARLSGRPSSSAAYNVGNVVDTPDSAIKSWRYLGAGEWEPNDAVRYTTGPGGGVEFPGLSQLTAAVRNAVQYIVSHADLEARPPRLWPVDAVPYRLFNQRAGVAYGHGTDQRQLVMVDTNTRAATTGYQFPSGWAISDIWPGHGCMLVMAVETATSTYSLWRTETGADMTRVHDLGRDPTGDLTHRPQVRILQRGLERGYLNGQPALMFGTYNVATDNSVAVAGEIGDAIYLAASTDDGVTWQRDRKSTRLNSSH